MFVSMKPSSFGLYSVFVPCIVRSLAPVGPVYRYVLAMALCYDFEFLTITLGSMLLNLFLAAM